jgi:acyl-CoA thioester hydrolase
MTTGKLNPDAERQNYRYFAELTTRWMDNDIYGHVNNVAYYSYFDTVANKYLIEEGGLDIQNSDTVGFVVASNCQYLAPIAYPEIIEVGFRANRIGGASVEYGMAIFKKGEKSAVAHGSFTHVFVNRSNNRSCKIPDAIRKALEQVSTGSN